MYNNKTLQRIYNNLEKGKSYGYFHNGKFYDVLKISKTNKESNENADVYYNVPDRISMKGYNKLKDLDLTIGMFFRMTPTKFVNTYRVAKF